MKLMKKFTILSYNMMLILPHTIITSFQKVYARRKIIIFRSVNQVICHGIPDNRQLQSGDIVNLDITVYKKGFHIDLNETYLVGEVA